MKIKILQKLFALSFVLVLLNLSGWTSTVQAQSDLLFGQEHSYSVIFRGNGEAIVYAKLTVNNSSETMLTNFDFEIPDATPTELAMFQQVTSPPCVQYDYSKTPAVCTQYGNQSTSGQQYYPNNYYSYGQQPQYFKLRPTNTEKPNSYTVKLFRPVSVNDSTTLIISYAAKGYVSKSFGVYKFAFPTIKVPNRIKNVTVSVDVDTELKLKGKKSTVDYGANQFEAMGARVDSMGMMASSPAMDRMVSIIGTSGPLVKSAKSVGPNESFIVNGTYAESWFYLYLGSIVKALLIIALIIAGLYYLNKYLQKRKLLNAPPPSTKMAAPIQSENYEQIRILDPYIAGMGLVSALIIILLTVLLQITGGSYAYGLFPNMYLFNMLLPIIALLIYGAAIFGPPAYTASKYGWKAFFSVLFAEVLWLIVLLVVYYFMFQSGIISQGGNYYGSYPRDYTF